ncbi:M23 family metallopeptidase [Salinicoccus siamensis]|uniref:lysostaphin n=1 Tax=Salinicoccus siamensis TaxID=381830 RepID=A0ABV5Z4I6_9STAP
MSNLSPEAFGNHFSEGDFEAIYSRTAAAFQNQMDLDTFVAAAKEFQDGRQFTLNLQNSLEPGIRRYQWLDEAKERMITVAFDGDEIIIGIQFDVYEKYGTDRELSINAYHLPFESEWFVLWGGNDLFLNYHYPYAHQRYAYDFIRKKEERSHSDDEGKNEAYHAFGSAVTAPRSGTVIHVTDGVADNLPGRPDMSKPEGNYIILSHEHDEYTMLAHLRKHSISVKEGDHVETGERLAQCGNSGASDTPHLHFHVMDQADPNRANAIRIQFADGQEPRQGETVKGRIRR